MAQDRRDQLYDNLINSGKVSEAEIGGRDEFKNAIRDEQSSRTFYDNLINSGSFGFDELGSQDDFYNSISPDFVQPEERQAVRKPITKEQADEIIKANPGKDVRAAGIDYDTSTGQYFRNSWYEEPKEMPLNAGLEGMQFPGREVSTPGNERFTPEAQAKRNEEMMQSLQKQQEDIASSTPAIDGYMKSVVDERKSRPAETMQQNVQEDKRASLLKERLMDNVFNSEGTQAAVGEIRSDYEKQAINDAMSSVPMAADLQAPGLSDYMKAVSVNRAISPDVEAGKVATQLVDGMLSDKSTIDELVKRMDMYGVSAEELADGMANRLFNQMYGEEMEANRPDSNFEYIMKNALRNAFITRLMSPETRVQRQIRREAAQDMENVGLGTRALTGAATMLLDMPVFALSGGAANTILGGSNALGRALIESSLKNKILSGAITFGGYDLLSGAVDEAESGEFNALRLGARTLKGAVLGGLVGGLGYGTRAATDAMTGTAKYFRPLVNAASLGAEAGIFTGAGELEKAANGQYDKKELWGDYLENLGTFGVLRGFGLARGMAGAGEGMSRMERVNELFNYFKQNGELPKGARFNSEEKEMIRDAYGRNYENVLREVADATINDPKSFAPYFDFIYNEKLPFTLRRKVMGLEGDAATPMPMYARQEGKRVLTYDLYNDLVSVKDYASEEEAIKAWEQAASTAEKNYVRFEEESLANMYMAKQFPILEEDAIRGTGLTIEEGHNALEKSRNGEPLSEQEQAFLNNYQRIIRENAASVDMMRVLGINNETESAIRSALKKNPSERTRKEQQAVTFYTDALQKLREKYYNESQEAKASRVIREKQAENATPEGRLLNMAKDEYAMWEEEGREAGVDAVMNGDQETLALLRQQEHDSGKVLEQKTGKPIDEFTTEDAAQILAGDDAEAKDALQTYMRSSGGVRAARSRVQAEIDKTADEEAAFLSERVDGDGNVTMVQLIDDRQGYMKGRGDGIVYFIDDEGNVTPVADAMVAETLPLGTYDQAVAVKREGVEETIKSRYPGLYDDGVVVESEGEKANPEQQPAADTETISPVVPEGQTETAAATRPFNQRLLDESRNDDDGKGGGTPPPPPSGVGNLKPKEEQKAFDEMPMVNVKGKMKPDFGKATPQRARNYIYEERGLDKADADKFVEANLDAAAKELDKQKKGRPSMGLDLDEFDEKMAAWKVKSDEAQKRYDYWKAVKDDQAKTVAAEMMRRAEQQAAIEEQARKEAQERREKEAKELEERRKQLAQTTTIAPVDTGENEAEARRQAIESKKSMKDKLTAAKAAYGDFMNDDIDTPADAFELVAMNMPHNLSFEGRDGVRGVEQELHLTRGIGRKGDTLAINPFLAKKGEGVSVDDAVHAIWESGENHLPDGGMRFDTSEIKDALLELLATAEKPTDISNYVLNNRIRTASDAKAAADIEEEKKEHEYIRRSLGMTPSEYDSYISSFLDDIAAREGYENSSAYFDAVDDYLANFAAGDEQLTNTTNDRQTENAGRGGEASRDGEVAGQDADKAPAVAAAPSGVSAVAGGELAGRSGAIASGNNGNTGNSLIPENKRRILTDQEIDDVLDAIEDKAIPQVNIPYDKEEWDKLFKNPIETPAGLVRMGEHQFGKLHPDGNEQHQDRRGWIGQIYQTLTSPDLIIEQNDPQEGAERDYKYVFVKSFINSSGESVTYFASVTVKKSGMEVVVTSHFKKYKEIRNLLKKGKLCFSSVSPSGMQTEANQPSSSATTSETVEDAGVSADKGSDVSGAVQEKSEKISDETFAARAKAIPGITEFEVTDEGLAIGNKTSRTLYAFEDYDRDGEQLKQDKEVLAQAEKEHEDNMLLSQVKSAGDKYATEYARKHGINQLTFDWLSNRKMAKEQLQMEELYRNVVIPYFEQRAKERAEVAQAAATAAQSSTPATQSSTSATQGAKSEKVLSDAERYYYEEYDPLKKNGFVGASKEQLEKAREFVEKEIADARSMLEAANDEIRKNPNRKEKDDEFLGLASPFHRKKTAEGAIAMWERDLKKIESAQQPAGDIFSQAEQIAKQGFEEEAKRTAANFPTETPEESAAFDKRIPDMSDEELLAYMREDGNGNPNKAYHPNLYDEYDSRHADEELSALFDKLFDTMEEKPDESGNVILYQMSSYDALGSPERFTDKFSERTIDYNQRWEQFLKDDNDEWQAYIHSFEGKTLDPATVEGVEEKNRERMRNREIQRGAMMREYLAPYVTKEYTVLHPSNMEETLKAEGYGDDFLADVREHYANGTKAFVDKKTGRIFLLSDGFDTFADLFENYDHERQHTINHANPQLLYRVIDIFHNDTDEMERVVRQLVGNDKYDGSKEFTLADEALAHGISKANRYGFDDARFEGLNEEFINLLKEIYDEQANDKALSPSRRFMGTTRSGRPVLRTGRDEGRTGAQSRAMEEQRMGSGESVEPYAPQSDASDGRIRDNLSEGRRLDRTGVRRDEGGTGLVQSANESGESALGRQANRVAERGEAGNLGAENREGKRGVVTSRPEGVRAGELSQEEASDEDILFRTDGESDIFISNARKAVEGIKQEKATPEQWLAMIEKAGGLKAGEDKWLGLSEWLKSQDKKSLTKQEVLDYIRENQIEIEEVNYGETDYQQDFAEYRQEYKNYYDEAVQAGEEDPQEVAWQRMIDERGDDFGLGFYALGDELQWDDDSPYISYERDEAGLPRPINSTRLGYTTKGLDNKREIALVVPSVESWNESDDIHFGDAGEGRAVAWVRFGDTEIPRKYPAAQKAFDDAQNAWDNFGNEMYDKYGASYGYQMTAEEQAKNKELREKVDSARSVLKESNAPIRVLVIDEIQSKRHQEGRERGYAGQYPDHIKELRAQLDEKRKRHEQIGKTIEADYNANMVEIYRLREQQEKSRNIREYESLEKEIDAISERISSRGEEYNRLRREIENISQDLEVEERIYNNKAVPEAPFDKNWHELAMKRMLRYAAENGYDKVAWTKGEQQAERYDLRKNYNTIIYNKDTQKLTAGTVVDGVFDYNYPSLEEKVAPEKLSDYVGKGKAEELFEKGILTGDDLKLGGEGMKGFYDDILPRFMNKYGKKWGAKVGEVELPNVEPSARSMWSVDVTPEMKESVLQGQPMFRDGVIPTYANYEESLSAARRAGYTKKQHDAMLERAKRRARKAAEDAASKLNLGDRVTIVESVDELPNADRLTDKQRRAKGWYDKRTGKIVVVLGNHTSVGDVVKTFLHEGVGHYGLRQLFGEHFDTFLTNAYNAADGDVRERIDALAEKYNGDTNKATEEYLASLAEDTDFEDVGNKSWLHKVKDFFIKMLRDLGLKLQSIGKYFSDNELRYVLWRSYKNLTEHAGKRSLYEEAEDIAKQYEMGVGDYESQQVNRSTGQRAAEESVGNKGRRGESMKHGLLMSSGEQFSVEEEDNLWKTFVKTKETHPNTVVLLKNGDYYIAMGRDLPTLHSLFHGLEDNKYMFIPEVELDNVLSRLIRSGNKVAIKELAKNGNTLAEPEVTEYNSESDLLFRDEDDMSEVTDSPTEKLENAAQKNKENLQERVDAMKKIGRDLSNMNSDLVNLKTIMSKQRSAMSKQRTYDKETVKIVTDLAKELMKDWRINDMMRSEIEKLLGYVSGAAGKEDISQAAGKIADLLIEHELRECGGILDKLLKTSTPKLNPKGVEVLNKLDKVGLFINKTMRDTMTLSKDAIAERIADCIDRMGSDDKTISSNAAAEYQGLLLAKQYIDDIKGSEEEEYSMRDGLKNAKEEVKAGTLGREDYKELERETENAIRENNIERIEKYMQLIQSVGGRFNESMERAKEWRDAEVARVREIQHNANSDMEGVPTDEHSKPTNIDVAMNNPAVRFFMKPLATFDMMLRQFGSKDVNGEGYLHNRFMGDYIEAIDKEWRNYHDAIKQLDNKVSEVFGKKMKWSDLLALERRMKGMDVTFYDGGEKKMHTLSQGNLLYIYAINKMSDGKMKLRRMGISEEDVDVIKEHLDPRFVTLADWIQDTFLKEKRNEYNSVYERLFGVPMAAIENYFPIIINSRSLSKEEEVGDESYLDDDKVGSTITGSVIKRKRNSLPPDLTRADFFGVVLKHIQDMEHWAAFAEFNRDLGTLLSYKHFRNQVLNMRTLQYGSGKTLWNNFKKAAAIASGAYRPKMDRDSIDTTAVNMAKGATQAKIALRFYTALKQLLSYPAYFSEANPAELAKTTLSPFGAAQAWNWAMKELPGFSKRWQSKQAGDNRLSETDVDWRFWRNRIVKKLSQMGMTPNATVDALTVAMGAKAIYETKYKRYIKDGYSEEQANKKALRDASVSYNETQQSSENAFLSAMQLDRTVASVGLSVFRNASMGYERKLTNAIRNIKHKLTKDYKEKATKFMTKKMMREGLNEEQAKRASERRYKRSLFKDILDVLLFGYGMQLAWNFGSHLPYIIFGKDKKKKNEMIEQDALHAVAGPIEGMTGGNVASEMYNMAISGQNLSNYNFNLLPIMSDIDNTIKDFGRDEVAAWNDVINLLMQAGLGVNPQTLTDAFVAIEDAVNGDPKLSKELAFLIMRVMNVPQSQLDEIYFDELGMNAREAQKWEVEALAERYAKYKRKRGAALTNWMYSDEAERDAETKFLKKFEAKRKERIMEGSDPETQAIIDDYKDNEYKDAQRTLDHLKEIDDVMERGKAIADWSQTPDGKRYYAYKAYKKAIDKDEKEGKYERMDSLKGALAEKLSMSDEELEKATEPTFVEPKMITEK